MHREIYCPDCGEKKKVKSIDGLMLVLSLFTGMIVLYLVYCAVIGSRICTGCKRRIYEVEDE